MPLQKYDLKDTVLFTGVATYSSFLANKTVTWSFSRSRPITNYYKNIKKIEKWLVAGRDEDSKLYGTVHESLIEAPSSSQKIEHFHQE